MSYYYSEHCYCPKSKEQLLNKAVQTAIANGSYNNNDEYYAAERLDSDGLYIRSFLIAPGVYNKRGWAISPDTARQNAYSAVGKPLVLYQNPQTGTPDHPMYNTRKSADANFAEQSRYKIGTIEKVFYNPNDGAYYADSKITDPHAREYIKKFKGNKLPIYVSPQILWSEDGINKSNYYTNWDVQHLAIVGRSAYDPAQAQVIGLCSGDGKTCHEKLQLEVVKPPSPGAAMAAAASASLGPDYTFDWRTGFTLPVPANGKPARRLA
jgi:hypothetical protein